MNMVFELVWGIFLLGVFSAFMSFILEKHVLSLLLSLELALVMLFSLLVVGGEVYMSLVYLILGVCEGVVGISLLVVMSRSFGGSYVAGYSLSRC